MQNALEEIFYRKKRIEHVREVHSSRGELFHEATDEQGLAGTDFAGHDNESLLSPNPVIKIRERLEVPRCPVEKVRIGTDLKRVFRHSVKLLIHFSLGRKPTRYFQI